mgnify:CR=1 FL=1
MSWVGLLVAIAVLPACGNPCKPICEFPQGVARKGGAPCDSCPDMTEPRLKTDLWVQAQVRLCDINLMPVAVRRRGDADAGAVLLRLVRDRDRSLLLKRTTTGEGTSAWMVVGGTAEVDDATAEAYVARELKRDDDLWVLEIEDPRGVYQTDGPLLR